MVSNGVEPIQRDLNLLPLFTNSTDPFSPFLPLSDFRRFSFRDNVTCKTASSLSSVIYITVRSLGLLYVLTSSSLSLSLFPLRPKIYLFSWLCLHHQSPPGGIQGPLTLLLARGPSLLSENTEKCSKTAPVRYGQRALRKFLSTVRRSLHHRLAVLSLRVRHFRPSAILGVALGYLFPGSQQMAEPISCRLSQGSRNRTF